MEFLRFGSSIPGTYWGCCAVDIIQNFKFDPDAKASIQLVSGDSGTPMGDQFCGPTYRDIFKQRIRIGTFSNREMPCHIFLAVLTSDQISGGHGKKWLGILREEGFEFIRATANSVYSSNTRPNYMFGLFRNIGGHAMKDTFTPPKEWTDMASPYENEPWSIITNAIAGPDLTKAMTKVQKAHWDANPPPKFLTQAEVEKAGAPVILAGQRSRYPQQDISAREHSQKMDKNFVEQKSMRAGNSPSPAAPAAEASTTKAA